MSATIVLPDPTSPCSSRFMGCGRFMSSTISAITFFFFSLSLKGSTRRADSRMSSVTMTERAFRSPSDLRRRSTRPSWNRKNSSKIRRRCAGVRKAFNCSTGVPAGGKWTSRSAARRSTSCSRARTSAGSGSAICDGMPREPGGTIARCIFVVTCPFSRRPARSALYAASRRRILIPVAVRVVFQDFVLRVCICIPWGVSSSRPNRMTRWCG